MKKYFVIAKNSFMRHSYYRTQSVISIITSVTGIIMMQFFWRALYAETAVVNDTTLQQMCIYSSVSWVLNLFQCESIQHEITDKVKSGDVILELLLPYNYVFGLMFKVIGENCWIFLTRALPVLAGVVLILQDTFAAVLDIPTIAVFILSAVLGNILLMFISFILALMSFNFVEISGLFVLKEIMITIFSGLVIPTWFFPGELAIIVNFLPFQYMIQVPLGFLCGRIDASEMGINLLIQIFWITAAVVLTFFIWRKNTANLESFGG